MWVKPVPASPNSESTPAAASTSSVPFDGAGGGVQADVGEPKVCPSAVMPRPAWFVRVGRRISSGVEWGFGSGSLIIGLAVLATIPIVQVLSLGYLLEASGRVARSGSLRQGMIGVRKAARLGSAALGIWLVCLPLRFVADLSYSAELLSDGSARALGWQVALLVLSVATLFHIAWSCFRGGRLRDFFWPAPVRFIRRFRQGGMFVEARDRLWDFVASLRLAYYFWLGLRGLFGAFIWLLVPVTLLVLAARLPTALAVMVGLVGAGLFALVLLYLPFLQTHFAAEQRWNAMFQVRVVRDYFRRAPLAFFVALLVTLAFALPLYLLKAELIPREAAWLPSLVFVVFIIPARLVTGWAVGRARRGHGSRHVLWRWTARIAAVPVVAIYVTIVYFTQYISWYGAWSLYEQHAFLVPVPFLGL